jgi:hypothetical protein
VPGLLEFLGHQLQRAPRALIALRQELIAPVALLVEAQELEDRRHEDGNDHHADQDFQQREACSGA